MLHRLNSSLIACLATLICAVAIALPAQKTESFLDDMVADFSQGDLTTSTLTWNGLIRPPYWREKISTLEEASVVWDIVESRGVRYIAAGHEGTLFRQRGDEAPEEIHRFEDGNVYALAANPGGGVMAAVSPGGLVYTVPEGMEPESPVNTGQQIVWDLLRIDDGWLAATGNEASIVRISDDGTTKTLAKVPEVYNILDLAAIPGTEDVAFATQGPGYIGRVTADGRVNILLDPAQEEVRRVAVLADGTVIGAVNGVRSPGEDVLKRTPDEGRARAAQKPRPESFIVRIQPDGFAHEWWTAPESPIHDLYVRADNAVIVAAGASGRLYEITPQGQTNHVGVADEQFVTRLAPGPTTKLFLGTGSNAAVFLVDPTRFREGIYDSRVFDAKGTVAWSRVHGRVEPGQGRVRISTRSGNTTKPDDTWHDWTESVDFSAGEHHASSPVGRFLQYRLHLNAADGSNGLPEVEYIRVFHTRANSPPTVKSVTVGAARERGGSGGGAQGPPSGSGGGSTPGSTGTAGARSLEISWTAEDPDGDPLHFDLYLVSLVDAAEFLIVEDHDAPRYTLDTTNITDGQFRVRVVARDDPGNPQGAGLRAEDTSGLFLIDNTPPAIIVDTMRRIGPDRIDIRLRVEDTASLIKEVSWRSGLDDYKLLVPEDGASDQRTELYSFTVDGEAAAAGRSIMVRATDEANNSRIERIVLE